MSIEDITNFTSTTYTYYGLDGEQAPKDTTEVIIHPSVITIKGYAFFCCIFLVRVTMPDTVTRVAEFAFEVCRSMRFIRFSPNLEFIGACAFAECKSLKAVFLSPTVTHIEDKAFICCEFLSFFYMQESIEHIGNNVVNRCHRLLITVKHNILNSEEVNQWLMQRHAHYHSIKLAPALPWLLKVFENTQLNVLRKLTINKWRHSTFSQSNTKEMTVTIY